MRLDIVRHLWPRRLRSQLALAVSVVLWSAILPLGLIALREQSAVVLTSIQDQAATLARNLALASEGPLVTNELDLIETLILRSAEAPQVLEIRILDSQGGALSHVLRPPGQVGRTVFDPPSLRLGLPFGLAPMTVTDDGQARVVAWHPVMAGSLLGWVRVDQSTAQLQALRNRLLLSTLLACVLAGLGCQLVLGWLMRQPLRAIELACHFAQGLQRSQGQQMAVHGGPQETQDLGHSLNQASSRLYELHQSVEHTVAQLRQQEASLADTNEQLRTIFALSPDGLVSFDEQGRVRFSNDAFHRLTGLTAEAVRQLPVDALEQQLRALCDTPDAFAGLAACFPADDLADASAPGVPRVRLSLSRPRLTVLELSGLRGLATTATQVLHVRDITRESEIDRLKSEFLNTAAHELRTPMTSIHACVELMQMREFDAPGRQKLLGIMRRQSTALVAVVDELLDLARIESRGAQDLDLAAADLGDVVRQAIGDFGVPAARTPPEWQAPAVPALPSGPVRLDRRKTAQVVRNLLSNA